MEQVVVQQHRREGSKPDGEKSAAEQPSEKQKQYILALARTAGLKVDMSSIADREKAARLIERLKLLVAKMTTEDGSMRDRRVAFGLATKLVFQLYVEQSRSPLKYKRFWRDVLGLYTEYLKQQEFAVWTIQPPAGRERELPQIRPLCRKLIRMANSRCGSSLSPTAPKATSALKVC